MEKELADGVEPNKIGFMSFTRKATEEAAERACERFHFSKSDLLYFGTIHSMAFRALGLKRTQVMQLKDYKKIGNHLGLTFTQGEFTEGPSTIGRTPGDRYAFIDGFSRARQLSGQTVWDSVNHDGLNWFEFIRYQDTVAEYKRNHGFYDFADMLEMGTREINLDVLIIDEAQDLSTTQWKFIEETFRTVKRLYIGGDDDQAIFEWSGADVGYFINLEGKRTVLNKSWRIPDKVHALAQDISGQIKQRADKHYTSKGIPGNIDYWLSIDDIDMSCGTWLLLARNSYLLGELSEATKSMGYNYLIKGKPSISKTDIKAITLWEKYRHGQELSDNDITLLNDYTTDITKCTIWHEAFDKMHYEKKEYYISLLRRGESLIKTPRINISTIHGSKGGEADHVVLLSDMAYSTWDSINLNQDAEHRVWYVGATRCKETLDIVMPRGRYYYPL